MTAPNSPPSPVNSAQLLDLFRRASRLMARVYHQGAHAHHAQGHVLALIRAHSPVKQRELLELLDVRSSSLSEVLAKLERNGLIIRQRDEADKRGFVISARKEAASPLLDQQDGYNESTEALFAVLDDRERRQLWELLDKIIQSMEDTPAYRPTLSKRPKRGRYGGGRGGKFHHRGRR